MTGRTRVPSIDLERIGREAVARSNQQRAFWSSGFHPVAWLRCALFHDTDRNYFQTSEDGRLIYRECGICSRPLYRAQRECCTPQDPCTPDDICRECQSYADPEDIR